MRDDRQLLLDIVEAIERIEKYASRGRDAFVADELLQTWGVYHLQIIGEAARSLSPDFRNIHPEVPWKRIIGMRNVLVHAYFGIDQLVVWEVFERDLPALKKTLADILSRPNRSPR